VCPPLIEPPEAAQDRRMSANQRWIYKNGAICSQVNNNYILDVAHDDTDAGSKVQLWNVKPGPQANQQWRLEASGHIVSVLDGMVLDVKHASKEKGATVCVYPRKSSNEANQLWSWTHEGYIISNLNGFVLDVKGGVPHTKPGAVVELWPKN